MPARGSTRRALLGMACGAVALPLRAADAASSAPAASPAPPPVPLERWGRLPALDQVVLSPSGRLLAYVRQNGDERTLAVFSLEGMKAVLSLRLGAAKVRGLAWGSEGHLLIATSATQALPEFGAGNLREWLLLQVLDLASRKLAEALPSGAVRGVTSMNVLSGPAQVRQAAGRTWLFLEGVYTSARRAHRMLVKRPLEGGEPVVVQLGDEDTQGWRIDAQGEVLAEERYDDRNRRWSVKLRRANDRFEEVLARDVAVEPPVLGGLNARGDALLVRELLPAGPAWRELSLPQGTLGPPVDAMARYAELLEDPRSARMAAGVLRGDIRRYEFTEAALQQRWDGFLESLGERHVQIVSATPGHAQVVVLVHGQTQAHGYLLFDLLADEGQPIGPCYPGTPLPHPVRRADYRAADGLAIPAYLTLPRGRTERGLPLVVLPHGGPQTADTLDFHWWSQALADQGWAVLRPNYRGSALNAEFVARGHGQWGRRMQSDLSDGVRHLAAQGLVDAGRVAIAGASYGGYAALAGATLEPRVYRCAVSVAGPSDLQAMLAAEDNKQLHADALASRYWRRFMGASGRTDPALVEISPARRVSEATPPVLLVHGKDDTVVPFEQSRLMERAMRAAGRPVELLGLEGEDHWLSRSDTRVAMLQATVAFLHRHNPA